MDERLLGKCGFYCGCCPAYIKGGCQGCMDEHQTGDCFTRDCVLKQGIDCCGACDRFPCDTIVTKPHTTVLDLLPLFEGYRKFRALDLGSGVGRNSIPVAQYFKEIPFVDMIYLQRKL